MIVYGDTSGPEDLRSKQAEVAELLHRSAAASVGIVRHGWLVGALIEAGELAQALIDERFLARGGLDACEPAEAELMALLVRLAGAAGRSWDQGFSPAETAALAAECRALRLPEGPFDVRHPEGFSHYALYPEAYWKAARPFTPQPEAAVIGLRSIGTTLAASVAAALEAPDAVTVRPVGHPFRRVLSLAPALEASWAAHAEQPHAVVDEGPGLSGSSFAAVADTLERLGVAPESMTFFPGHAGDLGAEADPAHRRRWGRSRRPTLTFGALTGPAAAPHQRLENWAGDLIGSPAALVDLSAGRWRALLMGEAEWPPADAQNEKLKFRAETSQGAFLLRFTGLGRRGHEKFEMARSLAAAGFGVAPLGWRHGFMVEPWLGEARPMQAGDAQDRAAVLARLPAYLAFRATRFAAKSLGASPAALHAMARANIAEALGAASVGPLGRWTPAALDRLAAGAAPVRVDGRLHPWEWLARPDGAVVKTDALDHHAAHDLVGAQDISWDIAGACVEWQLSEAEAADLRGAVESRTGRALDPALLALFALAYPAFQLGYYAMATERAEAAERPRLAARAQLYRDAAAAALASSSTKL